MSRGIRNCNPGNIRKSNIRYKGEISPSKDKEFKQFQNMEWGYRAMFMLMYTYQKKYGINTIQKIIYRYAPPLENHTEKYINAVVRQTGIPAEQPILTTDRETMIPIAAAMSRIENGVEPIRQQLEAGWKLFAQPPNK